MPEHVSTPRQRPPSVPRTCGWCGMPFRAKPSEIKRGVARFCSRSCGKRKALDAQVWPRLGDPIAGGCRPWLGALDGDGYGKVTHGRRNLTVTHVIWFLRTGHWPESGEIVAHHCDGPPCCEFSHLFLTTNQGNVRDRDQKGRQSRGERHRGAKLTTVPVIEMRARYAAGGISLTALGALYGVCYATARSAVKGEHWRHI